MKKELQSKDLRIGNLVETKYSSIHPVTSNTIIVIDYGIDIFQGIKITERWLLTFGFIKIDEFEIGNYDYFNKFGNFDVTGYWGEDGTLQGVFVESIGNFKYVHQLQNLYFSLTGEELEVKQ